MNVGFDMDGVIASRPRIFQLNHVKGRYRVKLAGWEKLFWMVVMHLRRPSTKMLRTVRKMKSDGDRLYLISGRLGFLARLSRWWIKKYELDGLFDEIVMNLESRQPHEFKVAEIERLKVKRYYEDEVFTANHIKRSGKCKVYLVIANGEQIIEF